MQFNKCQIPTKQTMLTKWYLWLYSSIILFAIWNLVKWFTAAVRFWDDLILCTHYAHNSEVTQMCMLYGFIDTYVHQALQRFGYDENFNLKIWNRATICLVDWFTWVLKIFYMPNDVVRNWALNEFYQVLFCMGIYILIYFYQDPSSFGEFIHLSSLWRHYFDQDISFVICM